MGGSKQIRGARKTQVGQTRNLFRSCRHCRYSLFQFQTCMHQNHEKWWTRKHSKTVVIWGLQTSQPLLCCLAPWFTMSHTPALGHLHEGCHEVFVFLITSLCQEFQRWGPRFLGQRKRRFAGDQQAQESRGSNHFWRMEWTLISPQLPFLAFLKWNPSLVDEMPLWHHQKGVEVFWHMNPECLHHRMSQGEVYKEKQRTSSKVAKGCKRHKTDQPVEPRHFYLQMPTLTNTHTQAK